jgi:DHA1 family bicyclomycin/chloramphenicol resistance-like MFS transporter
MRDQEAGQVITQIGFREFVGLMAALMATQAIPIDAMLPALPAIVRALGIRNENLGQWIITSYLIGLATGQLFWGVLSDRFGRRPMLLLGLSLYVTATVLCGLSTSFTSLLIWRIVHGLAASCMVITTSVVRDLYSGRHMARVMSLCFIVFLMVPVIAPSLGQLVLLIAPWRHIFLLFAAFGAVVALWTLLRLPETLHPQFRRTLNLAPLWRATRLVLGTRVSICYTLAQMMLFGMLVSYLGMVQQIFEAVYHRAALMPSMFALSAVAVACTSFLNSRIVERVGMRIISHAALLAFIGLSALQIVLAALQAEPLWMFVVLQSGMLATFGLAESNFMAMAMEPLGSVAGIGASLLGFTSLFLASIVGALIGRQFNGTLMPLSAGALLCGLASLLFVLLAEHGRLFRAHHEDDQLTAGSAGAAPHGAAGPH